MTYITQHFKQLFGTKTIERLHMMEGAWDQTTEPSNLKGEFIEEEIKAAV